VEWVALGEHVLGLEDGIGQLANGHLFVVNFIGGKDWSIRAQHEVDSGIRNQVGLEFVDIDIQRTLESQRGGQRADDLGNQSVEIAVGGSFDVQRLLADIIDGFIV
jgi:hypothetical protein